MKTTRTDQPEPNASQTVGQPDTETVGAASPLPADIANAIERFRYSLLARNRSQQTINAYSSDLRLFFVWQLGQNYLIETAEDLTSDDVIDYLADLGARKVAGVTRARKLAAYREFFRFLKLPTAEDVATPKKEARTRHAFRPEEYHQLLSLAGNNPRDYAILQVFLQTGIRVGELVNLTLDDIDLDGRMIFIRDGKGQAERQIELEKKVTIALGNWLRVRPESAVSRLFLNRYGQPFADRGIRKMVSKYLADAGIKRGSPHIFRHTFATIKAERNVSPFQLQEWLGHRSLATTQIYVHLGRSNAKKLMEATSL